MGLSVNKRDGQPTNGAMELLVAAENPTLCSSQRTHGVGERGGRVDAGQERKLAGGEGGRVWHSRMVLMKAV